MANTPGELKMLVSHMYGSTVRGSTVSRFRPSRRKLLA